LAKSKPVSKLANHSVVILDPQPCFPEKRQQIDAAAAASPNTQA